MKLKVFFDIKFLEMIHKKSFDSSQETKGFQVVKSILKEYPLTEVFINTEMPEQSEFQKSLISLWFDYPPICRPNFEEFVRHTSCAFSLFFMLETPKWFTLAKEKGALCFSWDDYESSIDEIITKCHFKIDLSEKGFIGWKDVLKDISKLLPTTQVVIVDKYILEKEIVKKSIVQIFQQFSSPINNVNYIIMTAMDKNNVKSFSEQSVEINRIFTSREISNVLFVSITHYYRVTDFHDRILYGQYFMVDSSKGFNSKHLQRNSNIQIIAETIFEKYTYKRMIRHKEAISKHITDVPNSQKHHWVYPQDLDIEII